MFLPQNFSVPSVVAGGQKPQKKEFYFQQTEYISNSDLSRIKAIMQGKAFRETPKSVFEFGAALDLAITEPKRFAEKDFELEKHHCEQISNIPILLTCFQNSSGNL